MPEVPTAPRAGLRIPWITRVLMAVARVAGGVSTLFHCCAASTLSLEQLRDGIRTAWQDFNDADEDVDEGLMPWEKDVVDRFIPVGSSVLVVGCGSGRDVIPLVERGCAVTGVDPADQAVNSARRALARRGLSAQLIVGFIRDAPLTGAFDTVVFSNFTYSFIPVSAIRSTALQHVADHLRPGGRVVISYQRVLPPRTFMVPVARLFGWLAGADWRVERGDFLTRRRVDGVDRYQFLHACTPDEIAQEAALAGLSIVWQRARPDVMVLVLERAAG